MNHIINQYAGNLMKKLLTFLILLFVASPAWCADEWLKTRPASTDQWTAWPAANQANSAALDRLLANYRQGMVISYSSATTVSVSAGEVMCSNSAGTVRKMRQNTSATNVTFTDIDTGSEEASKTYWVFANCDADATTATFKVSLSSSAPDSITSYKRLGSFYNDSSSNITVGAITNDNSVYDQSYGTWTAKSASTTYQALTDGLVHATIQGGGDRIYYGYTDSATTPVTLQMLFSTFPDGGEYAGGTMAVKKGDYWRVVPNGSGGTLTIYWLPKGN